jgi:hypothetical protein
MQAQAELDYLKNLLETDDGDARHWTTNPRTINL